MLFKHKLFLGLLCLMLLGLFVAWTLADVRPDAPKYLAKRTTDQKNEFAKRAHDVGRFKLPISNYGVHGQHETAGGSGGEWPNGSRDYYIFGAGVWIAAKVNGDMRCAVGYNPNDAGFEFYPGSLPNNTGEVGPDEVLYLSTDGEDYANWPLRNPDGTPKIVSIQDSYAIYNDMNPDWTFSTQKPLGVKVIQRGYAWNYTANQDIVFLTFDLINITGDADYPAAAAKFDKSTPAPPPNTTLKDVYFGPCCDPDIGSATDDMLDFDPSRNLGIVWDFDGLEANFENNGRTGWLGYDFLESPISDRDIDVNGDGVVNDDSVNFGTATNPIWVKDRRKGQQLGLTAWKMFVLQIDPRTDEERYHMMAGYDYRTMIPGGDSLYIPFDTDKAPEDKRFVQVAGPFDLAPGDTARVVIAIMVAQTKEELLRLSDLAQGIYDNNYFLPFPPIAPKLHATEADRRIILTWDDSPEYWADPFGTLAADPNSVFYDPTYLANDFQGYRVYRSLTGISGSWQMLAQYDKQDGYTVRIDSLVYKDGTKWPYEVHIGEDTGLKHSFVDTDVKNGIAYYYAVTSYDFQPQSTPITLECAFTNKVVAVPRAEQAGYLEPAIQSIEHTAGIADGYVEAKIIDPQAITGHSYEISITNEKIPIPGSPAITGNKFWHLKDLNTDNYVLINQAHFGAFGPAGAELPPADGLVVKLTDFNRFTGITKVQGAKDIGKQLAVIGYYNGRNVQTHANYRDFEYRFTGWTSANGDSNYCLMMENLALLNPKKTACTFELWDLGYFVDANGDGLDDHPEDDVRIWPLYSKAGHIHFVLDKNSPNTKYEEDFFALPAHNSPDYWAMKTADPNSRYDWDYMITGLKADPADTTGWTIGDVWRLENIFPITAEDRWVIKTKPITINKDAKELDKIRVVPNPFLIANEFMRDPAFKEIHFTHLPAKCTIRIFTTAGDLIATLHHDQPGLASDGYEAWNLTSKNNQLIASGVYIYHIESDFGSKIGKFAVVVK
ncbi:MAG: hypothetical protein ONB16_06695 [candidate division KSB1 bacterium]|nr:hypothetical protein [candidate division KSB1 bacterium]MDZ7340541.1 hypothetical protein [candidate division KSB1 bacterium]